MKITIKSAQEIADKFGADAAIVLIFKTDGEYQGASYGQTKTICKNIGGVLDLIMSLIDSDHIPVDLDWREGK